MDMKISQIRQDSRESKKLKIAKIFLASILAFGMANSANAVAFSEVLDRIDISGMVRYRYTNDLDKNRRFRGANDNRKLSKHQYRAEFNFNARLMDWAHFNLGLLYHNIDGLVGSGVGVEGRGLGSAADQSFGVSNLNLEIKPNDTKTTLKLGKMFMQTPYNDIIHDRAVGILASTKDLPNWEFQAAWWDSFSIDNLYMGYDDPFTFVSYGSAGIDKNLARKSTNRHIYMLSAQGDYKLESGKINAQIWNFHIRDILNYGLYAQFRFDMDIFHLQLKYSLASLNNGNKSALYALYSDKGSMFNNFSGFVRPNFINENGTKSAKFENNGDIFIAEIGSRFHSLNVPFAFRIGTWANFMKSYYVSLDNEGYYLYDIVGRMWFENPATGVTISFMPDAGSRIAKKGESNKLNTLYFHPTWDILDNLQLGLEYVYGVNRLKRDSGINAKITFHEITPILTWRINKSFRFTAYYAMLLTKSNVDLNTAYLGAGIKNKSEKYRFRGEVRFSF